MKTLLPQLVLVVIASFAVAQPSPRERAKVERFDGIERQSEMRVDGTSTLHDWTVKSPTIAGHITFKIDVADDAPVGEVKEAIVSNPDASADVSIEAKSLKSGKKDMDKKMHDALKV